MASVETTYGSYTKPLKNEVVREPKSTWDQDMFLKVLVAQMQYQDPMEPTSNTEFIGQMAQFSTLEQMTKMSASMLATQAYNLVGKYVIAEYQTEAGEYVSVAGKVDSTFIDHGITYVTLSIAEKDPTTGELTAKQINLPLTSIMEVGDGDATLYNEKLLEKLDEIFKLLGGRNPSEYVGKYVYAEYTPAGAEAPVKVAGKVEGTLKKDYVDYLIVTRPKVEDGNVVFDKDGKMVMETYEIPFSGVKEAVKPGSTYGSTGNLAIWKELDTLFNTTYAGTGGADGTDG